MWLAFRLAFKNLQKNKGRTALSLLGITIGIITIILILSLGQGIKSFIAEQIRSFGSDIIEIEVKTPKTKKMSTKNIAGIVGGAPITTLKEKDLEKVAYLDNLGEWYTGIMSQQITSFQNKNKQVILFGTTPSIIKVDSKIKIEEGRMFSEEENNGLVPVVVLGSEVKKYFFPSESAIGKKIKIGGKSFRVIGVFKKRGVTGFFNLDDVIYIPLKTLQKKIMGIDYVMFAIFKVKDMNKIGLTKQEIIGILRHQHHIKNPDDDDFSVNTVKEMEEILDSVFRVIDILLLVLASVSLIVGGVGIMNVMYVAVVERTKEIGLRKAVGATNNDILWQFIGESLMLAFWGALIGIFISFILINLATWVVEKNGYLIEFQINAREILLAVGFSALVGLIFGYYPARQAAKLMPAQAIKKEE